MPAYDAELEKRMMKHFAEIEMQRRRSETNLRFYNARERIQEDEEKAKVCSPHLPARCLIARTAYAGYLCLAPLSWEGRMLLRRSVSLILRGVI